MYMELGLSPLKYQKMAKENMKNYYGLSLIGIFKYGNSNRIWKWL